MLTAAEALVLDATRLSDQGKGFIGHRSSGRLSSVGVVGISRRNHVVPRGYLRGFADDHGMLRREGTVNLVPVAHAAVVKNAYVVTLKDGTVTDAVERSLSTLETKVLPILRELPDHWPLARPDRVQVAEYLAVQMSRTPDSLRHHGRLVAKAVHGTPHEADAGLDSLRMRAMYAIKDHTMTLLTAMQWTLVEFKAAQLSTSDHPVAIFPLNQAELSNDLGALPDNVGEVWFPVSRRRLLVLAWRDQGDTPAVKRGMRRVAEAVNSAIRDQAEGGWYWHPSLEHPPLPSSGQPRSIGELMFAEYGPKRIHASRHRAFAHRHRTDPTLFGYQPPTVFHPRTNQAAVRR